ncbi:MAG: phosphoribosylformylglycinamidine synthase subunit PurQ [Thermoplasmata archaeon]
MEEGIPMTRDIRVAVLTMEGTNNEEEAFLSFKHSGTSPEIVHLKKLENGSKKFGDYDILFFPGGFSAGDYVRAGAIMAARLKSGLMNDLEEFVESGRPVMGSCNGFQVLVELGLIPNVEGKYGIEAALAPNMSNRFEARTVYLKVRSGNCLFLREFNEGEVVKLPIAHSEGRFVTRDLDILKGIIKNGMNVITYVDDRGKPSDYPWNPNGSDHNIAGLCNKEGNVLGIMPHPERVFYNVTESDWTRGEKREGMGSRFFSSAVRFVIEKF